MSRYLPSGGFAWYTGDVDDALVNLHTMTETDDVGKIFDVDISYPQSLHDSHNELPFLPHASIPRGSSVRKLMATFEDKKRYIIHYINLKQAIDHGLVVDKVRIIYIIHFHLYIFIYIILKIY